MPGRLESGSEARVGLGMWLDFCHCPGSCRLGWAAFLGLPHPEIHTVLENKQRHALHEL